MSIDVDERRAQADQKQADQLHHGKGCHPKVKPMAVIRNEASHAAMKITQSRMADTLGDPCPKVLVVAEDLR